MSTTKPYRTLLGALVLLLSIIWSIGEYEIYENRQNVVAQAETARAYQAQAFAENTLATIKRINEILLDLRDDWTGDWTQFSNHVRLRQEHISDITFQVAIIDQEGYLAYSNLAPGTNRIFLGDREHFLVHKEKLEDQLFISKPVKGKVSGKWSVQFTRPIFTSGVFKGVIVASVSPDALVQFHPRLNLTVRGVSSIARDTGEILARFPGGDDFIGKTITWPYSGISDPPTGTFRRVAQLDNVERIYGYYKIPDYHLAFFVGESFEEVLGEHTRYQAVLHAALGTFTFVLIVIFAYLQRAIFNRENAITLLNESQTQQRILATAVEQSPASIVVTNLAGDIQFVNEAFTQITGYSAEEVNGKNPRILKSGLNRPELYEKLWSALTSGHSWKGELQNRKKNGELYWEAATISPVKNDHGVVTHYLAVKENITERKRSEVELRHTKEAAEAANIAKSQFLATMSHEIRTPMNGILGMAQILQTHETDKIERDEYVKTIINSGQTLLTLLNDILDLSKVEAGKLELTYSIFDPAEMLDETAALFAGTASNKGVTMAVINLCPNCQTYWADPIRIRQMISNLVSNAIKFTESGTVEIMVEESAREGNSTTLRFSVKDSGIGIPLHQQERLFQPFSQIDGTSTRKFGGTGLGLSIVRRLAELMGGEVGVISDEGKGSTFWFKVKVDLVTLVPTSTAQRPDKSSTEKAPSSGHAATVMVVEDTQMNLMVIEAMLLKAGYSFQSYRNGRLCVEAFGSGVRPEVILMDCQMPEMDGFEATQAIRRLEGDLNLRRTPIVALTADAFQQDREHCLSVGMDDYLTKPIDLNRLSVVLSKWIRT